MLGERRSQTQVVIEETVVEEIACESRVNPVMKKLTPVKIMEDERHGSLLLGMTPFGTPVKRVSNIMFNDGELDIDPAGSVRPSNLSRPDMARSFRTVALVEGASTDMSLSDIDAMVGQCSLSRQAGPKSSG